MLDTMLSTVFSAQHVLFALATDHNEAAYRVILGLGIIGAIEVACGLWLIRAGEGQHSHKR